jgi:hypothetical protein
MSGRSWCTRTNAQRTLPGARASGGIDHSDSREGRPQLRGILARSPYVRWFRGFRCGVLVGLLAGLLVAVASPAGAVPLALARSTTAKVVRLYPHFRRLGRAAYVLGSGRHVFWAALVDDSSRLGTLLDEATGRSSVLAPPPGCAGPTGPLPVGPELMGGPWLLVDCADAQSDEVELYDLAARKWTAVTPNATVLQFCDAAPMSTCLPVAVGADWIEFDETCYHCGNTYVFQDVHTGARRQEPSTPDSILNLNSPSLTEPVCAPLRVPRTGSLIFDGLFAVAEEHRGDVLERCGTTLAESIGPVLLAAVDDPHAIAWQSESDATRNVDRVQGVFLPTLRRFVLMIPRVVGPIGQMLLTASGLFVLAGTSDELWTSSALRLPPKRSGASDVRRPLVGASQQGKDQRTRRGEAESTWSRACVTPAVSSGATVTSLDAERERRVARWTSRFSRT